MKLIKCLWGIPFKFERPTQQRTIKHVLTITTKNLQGIWSIPDLQNISVKISNFWGGLFLTVISWKMRRPLLTFQEKNLRRVAIGSNRENIIVLANKQRLVSIARQDTVIIILPLIGINLWTVSRSEIWWWNRLCMVTSKIGLRKIIFCCC